MSMEKVDYGDLLPGEFEARLAQRPAAYLPLGTLEWHGVHGPLGADYIQSQELFRRAARAFGGIVLPPLWLGPDRRAEEGEHAGLIGMDYAPTTDPHRQLPGSLYWVPKEFFHQLVEAVLAQAKRAGFACVVADGHGPSRWAFGESVDAWELQFDLKLVSVTRDFPEGWQSQVDHAGKNETSILLAAAPNLVDMSLLPEDRDIQPEGTSGGSSDPRDASPEHGETCLETSLALIGKKLDELGI